MLHASSVIRQNGLSYHFFAEDSQLQDSTALPDLPRLASDMSVCIKNDTDWMKTVDWLIALSPSNHDVRQPQND